jgi:cardiolipin synthase
MSTGDSRPTIFDHPEGTSLGDVEVDRVLTVPNVITTLRLLCVPVFVYLLFGRDSPGWAGFMLGALGATDWVDGFIARRFNQGSAFGKMYDPTVDRLMLGVGIIAIMIHGSAPLWYCVVVLAREVLVGLWVVVVTLRSGRRMNVTWWGKVGAFANMTAFPWFLFAAERTFSNGLRDAWRIGAYGVAIIGVVFSLLSAWQYVGLGRQALSEPTPAHH